MVAYLLKKGFMVFYKEGWSLKQVTINDHLDIFMFLSQLIAWTEMLD